MGVLSLNFRRQKPSWTTLDYIGAEESVFKCVDCKTPTLIGSARTAEGIHEVNQLAAALAEMPQKRLTEYKAILIATKCSEFDDAIQLLGAMGITSSPASMKC